MGVAENVMLHGVAHWKEDWFCQRRKDDGDVVRKREHSGATIKTDKEQKTGCRPKATRSRWRAARFQAKVFQSTHFAQAFALPARNRLECCWPMS